ncbi:MAG: hypothetical protein ABIY55_18500, partial [Kofleriaceae bacterium]
MPRFTCLIVALATLAVAACEKKDPLFCPMHPDDMACMVDAPPPPPPPPPCTDNAGCKSPTEPVCEVSAGDGVCVVCSTNDHPLCKDTKPICADHMCQGCRNASDCPLSGL